ncbi:MULTISPECIES: hypothetical protein [unclassified Undibacterium]|uniref:hypothetical protein n=1 Tax=unclassified Undibacterium TaxID=2630295 RepID=UPI002AC9B30A|nr:MULTISPECIES: hypothetical protein [unclassified Undibacterium]MEB0138199.1 hypothetical protein [Undibacterium sp. CCC2.1]MEB0171046.1 hypothetical protein [Undibacterium sp. CCC1.1]MEB0175091.1 hypothetical protein [Undibacterium sp. CCC3.4]MEB0214325.1 hypothetical protein [Undibacterium sp. 5I2]WPX41906.1 hypothetical protein RHM61_10790 [Undibacterium sp. CCC3.4]
MIADLPASSTLSQIDAAQAEKGNQLLSPGRAKLSLVVSNVSNVVQSSPVAAAHVLTLHQNKSLLRIGLRQATNVSSVYSMPDVLTPFERERIMASARLYSYRGHN